MQTEFAEQPRPPQQNAVINIVTAPVNEIRVESKFSPITITDPLGGTSRNAVTSRPGLLLGLQQAVSVGR